MKSKEIIVSVIIPVYNVEKYIDRCISSTINQVFDQSFEIILVDDGSKDNSYKLCRKWAEKYNNILLVHKENGGQSSARNVALDLANGEYITFVDSDDYLESNYLKELYSQILLTGADISICNSNRCVGDNGEGPIFDSGFESDIVTDDIAYVLKHCSFAPWNKLYRRELFGSDRFPEGMTYEDYAFIPQVMFRAKKISYKHIVTYHYFVNMQSTIMSKVNTVNYHILKAHEILEKSSLINEIGILTSLFIRRVLGNLCFSIMLNDHDINKVKKIVTEGKVKYKNLKAEFDCVKMRKNESFFVFLIINDHYYLAFLYCRFYKFIRTLLK